jgi:hypothetical protein
MRTVLTRFLIKGAWQNLGLLNVNCEGCVGTSRRENLVVRIYTYNHIQKLLREVMQLSMNFVMRFINSRKEAILKKG